jgi:hypothetical protein
LILILGPFLKQRPLKNYLFSKWFVWHRERYKIYDEDIFSPAGSNIDAGKT